MPDAKQPWERQPGETDDAFRAFAHYRDLGAKRSLLAVTRAIQQRRTESAVIVFPGTEREASGKSAAKERKAASRESGRVNQWSVKHAWLERVRAWDEYLDQVALRKTVSVVEAMAERHAKQNEHTLGVLMIPFLALAKALKDPGRNDLDRLPASELLKPALFASRELPKLQEAERIARGVRVMSKQDAEAGAVAATEWQVQVFQPEREGPGPEALIEDTAGSADAWEVDPQTARRRRDDGDDEDDE